MWTLGWRKQKNLLVFFSLCTDAPPPPKKIGERDVCESPSLIVFRCTFEMESFTALVFGTDGRVGADCNCFLKRLAEKLSEKNEEPYHITITWIRTLLSFEILRSVHTCVRGSRTPFHKIPRGDFIDDWRLNATQACVIMAWARKLV